MVLLNTNRAKVEEIVSRLPARSSRSDRFHAVVEAWLKEVRGEATLGRFLMACGHLSVDVMKRVEEALLAAEKM